MQTIKKQQGMATILLVLLIGITVMLITASVARALMTKKEAATAAHAQTNAQILGWAGVNAFREYLLQIGKDSIAAIENIPNTVTLLSPDGTTLTVTNISADQCGIATPVGEQPRCTVTADIKAVNGSSKSATTIAAVYKLKVVDGELVVENKDVTSTLSGNTILTGVHFNAELPNTTAIFNNDGDLSILNLKSNGNIKELNINVNGDVYIDCAASDCSSISKININATGKVTLLNGGNYGTINAKKAVDVTTNVKIDEISSLEKVTLRTSSQAGIVRTNGSVEIQSAASADEIYAKGNVTSTGVGSKINSKLYAEGNVSLSSTTAGEIRTAGNLDLLAGSKVGNVYVKGEVTTSGTNTVINSIEAGGYINLLTTTVNGRIIGNKNIRLESTKVHGNVYSNGTNSSGRSLYLSLSDIYGEIFTRGSIYVLSGSAKNNAYVGTEVEFGKRLYMNPDNVKEKSSVPNNNPNPDIPNNGFITSLTDTLNQQIDPKTIFNTLIDVKPYKLDANYIFDSNTFATIGYEKRVYLNHLKNPSTGLIYYYKEEKNPNSNAILKKQYSYDPSKPENQRWTYLNDTGFYIAQYTLGGRVYSGALCLERNNNACKGEIVGYFPRLATTDTLGADINFGRTGSNWHLRAGTAPSSISNAVLAPGILYFDANLELTGNTASVNNSDTSAFTNSILAEGYIDLTVSDPRVYSPYNALRDGGNEAVICDRLLKDTSGAALNSSTTPITLSNKYLIPVNLCNSSGKFAKNMHLDDNGNPLKVTITDNNDRPQLVDKIDLGYVALMANLQITISGCSLVYGDVLSRRSVGGTSSCQNRLSHVVGGMSSQGKGISLNSSTHGSKITYANPDYTGNKTSNGTTTTYPTRKLTASTSESLWARYK